MKIIDSKGKLFGIINIIDLLVIAIIVTAGFYGIGRIKPTDTNGPSSEVTYADIVIRAFVAEVRQETVDVIIENEGVIESTSKGFIGTVIEKKAVQATKHITTSDGRIVKADIPERFDVEVFIKARAKVEKGVYVVSGRDIKVGTVLALEGKTGRYSAVIFSVEEK